ncbi:MAG: hypothetical protein D4R97_00390 [Bacteroidetes bacterium]|nr:MAG: hypothetical protein D4R97_00390 [Bacteroidota bacterium]
MKWKLIFLLSLFGLAMAFATVFWIPTMIEPAFWLAIFIICAYLIAKNCTNRYFLYGFLVALVNCVWITGIHLFYHNTYMANHPDMVRMMADMPMPNHPLRMMALTGPVFGILSGLVLGLFAYIASRLVKKNNP